MTVRDVAARFKDAHMENGHYMAACPCHSDKTRSLDIVELGGRIRLRCHAGCPTDRILEAAGLDAAELTTSPENLPARGKGTEEPADGPAELITFSREMVEEMAENSRMMGRYIGQLGQMMAVMQRRMDEMERQQAAVTIRHEDVKRLQAQIRMRADQICGKYELTDRDSLRIFRAAIKKDLLKRYGVRDLHDIPAVQLSGAQSLVDGWTNIRLVMERRAGT